MTNADEQNGPDWAEVRTLLDDLYSASERLEVIFPGRKFTLDGHLVGSIGEAIAAYMFDLKLNAASTMGYDAVCVAGRCVEIKLTQGKGVAIRHPSEHLVVLQRPKGGPAEVVYNGPGAPAWDAAGAMGKNGQRPIAISTLLRLNATVSEDARLPLYRKTPV